MLRSGYPFTGLACFLTAVALVVGACRGGREFTALTADDPVAEIPEGISVSANPAALTPDFGVQLTAFTAEALSLGQAGEAWTQAMASVPNHLRLQSPVFDIQTTGELPPQIFLSVVIPTGANPAVLELYAWDGEAWTFLPAQARGGQLSASVSQVSKGLALFEAAGLPPLVYTTLEPGQALSADVAASINAVLIGGVLAQADGSLTGQVPGVPLDQAFAVYPVVRSYTPKSPNTKVLAGLLGDERARVNHLQTLLAFVLSGSYDGLVLDYHVGTVELGAAYTRFVSDLAGLLHAQGKGLFVQVEVPTRSGETFTGGGYDWLALGASADALFIPVSDDPTAFGDGSAEALLAWAVGEVSRSRLRLMTSGLSVDHAEGGFTLLDQASALAPLGSVTLTADAAAAAAALIPGQPVTLTLSGRAQTLAYDSQAFAVRYAYADDTGAAHTVWLTSPETLRQRLALAEKYRLGGVVVSDLGALRQPAGMVNAITQYKVIMQAAAQSAGQAGLFWTVSDAYGILAQATAQPGQPYIYVAQAPGAYQVSAELRAGGEPGGAVDLGSAAIQVASVTATPEVRPTAIPNAAGSGSGSSGSGNSGGTFGGGSAGGGVFVPPPPVSGGPFELGGQVPGFIGHSTLMQQAGMKWVKTQAAGDMGGFIANAHAAGFKVLVSALGDHARAADPAYWPEYASWVAGMAAQGADAIEVWNEANIDREWPTGKISGATYTELLKQAYNAIKAANGNTLVISGAPAPTGAEGAFPGQVVNDDNFLRQMAGAGAASYLDCVGVHYNSGTTSPHATTGSALSGYHYSFYFWPMVDLYYNTFGGSRPLCFTELGYLTPEGYGSLPPAFGWAANTSVAQQAQWLADTASLSGGSGKVRLMIVFNVDFTLWGADPQGGYAILRPDGTCPACSALDAVMP